MPRLLTSPAAGHAFSLCLFSAPVPFPPSYYASYAVLGWGTSFHFAHRVKGESHEASIKRHEHYLALKLRLEAGHKVLDVGCGVGGPLREIAMFSGAAVTGEGGTEQYGAVRRGMERYGGVPRLVEVTMWVDGGVLSVTGQLRRAALLAMSPVGVGGCDGSVSVCAVVQWLSSYQVTQ